MVDHRDAEVMIRLAREGKQIAKIWREDFPHYEYWEIYSAVYGEGEKSALGTKRMITRRLNKLVSVSKAEQEIMIEEIQELVTHLYDRYKESQQKLDEIRKVTER